MFKKVLCVLGFIVLPIFPSGMDINLIEKTDVESAYLKATDDHKDIKSGWISLQQNKTIIFDSNEDGTYRGKVIDHNEFGYRHYHAFDTIIKVPCNETHIPVDKLTFDKLTLLAFTKTGIK